MIAIHPRQSVEIGGNFDGVPEQGSKVHDASRLKEGSIDRNTDEPIPRRTERSYRRLEDSIRRRCRARRGSLPSPQIPRPENREADGALQRTIENAAVAAPRLAWVLREGERGFKG